MRPVTLTDPPVINEPIPSQSVPEVRKRGQSAVNSTILPSNSNEIPQEYINLLNYELERKFIEFKTDYKSQELRHQ